MGETDLISRQTAIDAIEILLEQSEDDEHDKTWNNAIRGSINAIKHHVSSAQQRIPCSESLPKRSNVYTVTDSKGDVVVFYDTVSSRKCQLRCAKAWTPLPEPYKEDNNG